MNVNTRYTSPPYPPHSTQPFPILSFQPLVSFFLPPPSSYHSHSTIFSFFMFITPPFLFILLLLTIFLPSHPPCSHPPRPNTYPPPLSHTNSLNLLTYPPPALHLTSFSLSIFSQMFPLPSLILFI